MVDGLANGKPFSVPTLFADNVYSPVANIAAAMTAYRNSKAEYCTDFAGTEHHIKYMYDPETGVYST